MNINQIQDQLKIYGYSTKIISGKRIRILSESTKRQEVLRQVESRLGVFGAVYDPTRTDSTSSIGWVQLDNGFRVYVKPAHAQGNRSAGIENELTLVNELSQYIALSHSGSVDVKLNFKNSSFVYPDVYKITEVGRQASGRAKADVLLHSKSMGIIPLSLKKDNAECWESGDKYHRDAALRLLSGVEVEDIPGSQTLKRLPVSVARRCDPDTAHAAVFGSDNATVVVATFDSRRSFAYDDRSETVTIGVTDVFESLSDLDENHYPYMLVRNDRTRTKGVIPGVRVLIVTGSRINKKVKLV
ncbi:hypothetical protein EniLVp02_0205 [Vibrio phage EniLVp02]